MELSEEKIKQAAESLYNKGEISYEELEKVAMKGYAKAGAKAFKNAAKKTTKKTTGDAKNISRTIDSIDSTAGAIDKTNKAVQGTMDTIDKIKREGPELFRRKSKSKKVAENAADKLKTYALPTLFAGTGAALAKENVVDPATEAIKINQSYNKMFEKHPNLKEEDENQVKDYFNVVKTYSPAAAKNPVVAGSMVNRMVEFEGVDHNLVSALGNIKDPDKDKKVTQSNLIAGKSVQGLDKAVAGGV